MNFLQSWTNPTIDYRRQKRVKKRKYQRNGENFWYDLVTRSFQLQINGESQQFHVLPAHGLALSDRRRTAGGQENPTHGPGGAAKIDDWVKLP